MACKARLQIERIHQAKELSNSQSWAGSCVDSSIAKSQNRRHVPRILRESEIHAMRPAVEKLGTKLLA
ncbi:hypothetical protein BDV98DRAFT_379702 [Pterulicium gracile]|uniref:Uncharacterized protein n=1 Tax=Pterulicium gracile TaxID=1884261 RepID=A0A5C3QY32_9AGAR|nr:hypothetical protein BDV98DRAFT_379702 [Pterula gracilis]